MLTKPDLLPAGSSYEPLEKVLSNLELKFGHGYFVVKNPDQVMLNNRLTHPEARVYEQQFFETQQPWSSDLQAHRARFGTANLQQYLSEKLAGQMVKALPGIYEQVRLRLEHVDEQLKLYPEPPPNYGATRIILDLVIAFSDHIRQEVRGDYPCKDWRNSWKELRDVFFDGLDAMKPSMMRRGQLDDGLYSSSLAGKSSDDPLCLSDGDDGDMGCEALPATPQNKRKLERMSTPASNKKGRYSMPPTPSKPNVVHGVDYNGKRKVFQLDEVCQHLEANSQSKISGHIEPKVIEDMVRQTIAHWNLPLQKLLLDLESCMKKFFLVIFKKYFDTRKETKLYEEAWQIVLNILDTSLVEQRAMANDAFNDEIEGPYTFHEAMFKSEKSAMQKRYNSARFETRLKVYMEEMAKAVGEEKVPTREKLLKNDSLCSRLKEEPYEVEIDIVAQITSYYVLAVRRFHDSICMRVESKLFTRLRSRLRDEMEETLAIHEQDGVQQAMRLLAEPSQHAAKRKELLAVKSALLQGRRELDALYERHGHQLPASQGSHGGYPASVFNSSASFGPTSTPLTDEMLDITQSGRVRR